MSLTTRTFADGAIAVRARLAVNPDGGAHSYIAGDHGFTYIGNGVNRLSHGRWVQCDTADCRKDFLAAEKRAFARGTKEFCAFAFEVDPYQAGQARQSCGAGRYIVGNGKGIPKSGAVVASAAGEQVQTYLSTTSIRHTVQGAAAYLDAESLPVAVTPSAAMLGKVVWIRGKGFQDTKAVIGDIGPAFGEGSIALHQLLRTGAVTAQRPGPIPAAQRCGASETLQPPFKSSPDKAGDICRPGRAVTSATDIRAYIGIEDKLDFLILPGGFPLKADDRTLITEEVSRASIDALAQRSGYTDAMVSAKLACLPQ
ncbi:hypothetical protein RAS12_05485 [Achromobacter seleniivolatilans]|uniref:Uncharacterized protein n=1 Tax=Achromobacter seleniivolatilans TaxID=3047478 RepID=A0ABY9M5G3_9BURK|nr:hypothetical protein [Achromobacter sp. R39]WMD21829.1 hypothetical protein RAS12_05485 [Achromobacter sp. R39]